MELRHGRCTSCRLRLTSYSKVKACLLDDVNSPTRSEVSQPSLDSFAEIRQEQDRSTTDLLLPYEFEARFHHFWCTWSFLDYKYFVVLVFHGVQVFDEASIGRYRYRNMLIPLINNPCCCLGPRGACRVRSLLPLPG